jgi:peptidoglycan hydrolase CwlO-like protein
MSNQQNQQSQAQQDYGKFMGQLQQLKTRFNSAKGQADGIVIDGMSSVFENVAQEIQKIYASVEEKDKKITALEKEIDGLKPKIKKSEVAEK